MRVSGPTIHLLSITIAIRLMAIVFAMLLGASAALGQTSSFTYQGRLTDGGTAATGSYDFQFALFDSPSGGNLVGAPQTINPVAVNDGVFVVKLDFGAAVYPGADRFLEIDIRPSGNTGGYQQLLPRQKLAGAPYAIQVLRATTAIAANGLTTGASASLIQNTTAPQSTANLIISGNGTAGGTLAGNIVTTSIPYTLGGIRILDNPGTNNLFVGVNAGAANTTQRDNTFIGAGAGQNTGTGDPGGFAVRNTFVGSQTGNPNTTGQDNSFFGAMAGQNNSSGFRNSFFGVPRGNPNMTSGQNSVFGEQAGSSITSGENNSFFGEGAGFENTTGNNNNFFGSEAGEINQTGSNNTYIGFAVQPTNGSLDPNLDHATGIGANTEVNKSNSIVLGRVSGATLDNVGIGISAPTFKLHVVDTGATGLRVQTNTTGGKVASFGQKGAFQIDAANVPGGRFTILENGNVGIGTPNPFDKLDVVGTIRIGTLGSGADTTETLCRNNINQISICSSSLRYKTKLAPFATGLRLIKQLQPITFDWKADARHDVGFGAEDVARLNPLFVTYNQAGQVEGVKYDRFATLFVNGFKEQQAQLETQRRLINVQQETLQRQRLIFETRRTQAAEVTQRLQARIEAQQRKLTLQEQTIKDLRTFVCLTNAQATVCKEN